MSIFRFRPYSVIGTTQAGLQVARQFGGGLGVALVAASIQDGSPHGFSLGFYSLAMLTGLGLALASGLHIWAPRA